MNPQAKKILLVEDEDFIRELYARQLNKAGFLVKSATDGQTGLDLLKTEQFDLLLFLLFGKRNESKRKKFIELADIYYIFILLNLFYVEIIINVDVVNQEKIYKSIISYHLRK